ncbi:testis-specific protein TSX-like [Chionomys nivalis]|uniref:testis-specific protein TSX-like n=1 Tax=Chionomys nivalis TaxID=269649 RepID=UPI00259324B1|nr:testis-specific protein TSX-like [Chionomys nivalis]
MDVGKVTGPQLCVCDSRFGSKDDDMETQEDRSLGYTESFLCLQDILHENKINSIDDSDTRQAGSAKEDDGTSHSDSDIDDNVKVIIGNIKTNPSMYMEMLTDLNSEGEKDVERIVPDNAMNPTD